MAGITARQAIEQRLGVSIDAITGPPDYQGPPVQPCCGKRHMLPHTHAGMIRCGSCGEETPTPAGKRWGSLFCAPCETEMTGRAVDSGRP